MLILISTPEDKVSPIITPAQIPLGKVVLISRASNSTRGNTTRDNLHMRQKSNTEMLLQSHMQIPPHVSWRKITCLSLMNIVIDAIINIIPACNMYST